MSCDQCYPLPQVFLVDGGGGSQDSAQPPSLVPCWSFPPAQQRVRSREKSRGTMVVSFGGALIVLMLFLLVFAALGVGAYQIYNMQKELKKMKEAKPETEFNLAEKQIGHYDPGLTGEDKDDRPAAHVIGRIEKNHFYKTLRWQSHLGRAFVSGGVAYRFEDGALQVNETGLYHIYSRVELIFKDCTPTSSVCSHGVCEESRTSHDCDPDGGQQSRFLLSAKRAPLDLGELPGLCPAAAEIRQSFCECFAPQLSHSCTLCQLLWSLQDLKSWG
ncbi:Tumor necrosis factor ligand superfamily member 6 CD95 ligand [Collichthys lucidus]|uniref:Tumor necrosis factor ligand superfamily member 6 CD95 ligand n=1 Tax=Collichthys lucidus TaxID=240159 RepID=A0A4U5UJ37_COLLU|nr:Tumor necrosis factor ligand superfamily member 6 CD95 ligand [Collichthys lucidus]